MIDYEPFIFEGIHAPKPDINQLILALQENEALWIRAAIVHPKFAKAIAILSENDLSSEDETQILKSFQRIKALQLRYLLKHVITKLCQGDWQTQRVQAQAKVTISTKIEREAFALLTSLYPAHHSSMEKAIDWAWQKIKAEPKQEIELMLMLWKIWPLDRDVLIWQPYISYMIQHDPLWGSEIAQRLALYYQEDCLKMVDSLEPMQSDRLMPFKETLEKHLRRIFAIKLWVHCREILKSKMLILLLFFYSSLCCFQTNHLCAQSTSLSIDDLLSQIASPDQKEIYLIPNLKWIQPIQSILDLTLLNPIAEILDHPQFLGSIEDQQSIICLKDLKTEKFLIVFKPSMKTKIDEIILTLSQLPILSSWSISQAFDRIVLKQNHPIDQIEWFKNQWIVAEHDLFKDCILQKGEADFFGLLPWGCFNLKLDPQDLKITFQSKNLKAQSINLPIINTLAHLGHKITSEGLVSLSFRLAEIDQFRTWFKSKLIGQDEIWLKILDHWRGDFHFQWGNAQEAFAIMLGMKANKDKFTKEIVMKALDRQYVLNIDQHEIDANLFVSISHQKQMKLASITDKQDKQDQQLALKFEMKATDIPKTSQFYEDLLAHHLQLQPKDVLNIRTYFEKIAIFNQSWGDVLVNISQINTNTNKQMAVEIEIDRY